MEKVNIYDIETTTTTTWLQVSQQGRTEKEASDRMRNLLPESELLETASDKKWNILEYSVKMVEFPLLNSALLSTGPT